MGPQPVQRHHTVGQFAVRMKRSERAAVLHRDAHRRFGSRQPHGGTVFGMVDLRDRGIKRQVRLLAVGRQAEANLVDIQSHSFDQTLCRTAVREGDIRLDIRDQLTQRIQSGQVGEGGDRCDDRGVTYCIEQRLDVIDQFHHVHWSGQVHGEPVCRQIECRSGVRDEVQIELLRAEMFAGHVCVDITHLRAIIHRYLLHVHEPRYAELMLRLRRYLHAVAGHGKRQV